MLSPGELRCIGATKLDEYRKYVGKDAPFEQRFQGVFGNEPSEEDTLISCRSWGLRDNCLLQITATALVAAASLSKRYISGWIFPDKAIDLVDEACMTGPEAAKGPDDDP